MIKLGNDEKILWQGQPHTKILVNWCLSKLLIFIIVAGWIAFMLFAVRSASMRNINFLAFFIGFPAVLIALIILMFVYLVHLRKTYEYYITNQRVVFKGGILNKKERSVPFHKITDVEVTQHILEQILDISKLNIQTAGSGAIRAEMVFSGLEDPNRPAEVIKNIIKTYKSTGE